MHCWSFSKQLHWPGAKLTGKSQQVSETIISKPPFKLHVLFGANILNFWGWTERWSLSKLTCNRDRSTHTPRLWPYWTSQGCGGGPCWQFRQPDTRMCKCLKFCLVAYIGKRWQKTSLLQNSDFEALLRCCLFRVFFNLFAHRKPSTWHMHSAHLSNVKLVAWFRTSHKSTGGLVSFSIGKDACHGLTF